MSANDRRRGRGVSPMGDHTFTLEQIQQADDAGEGFCTSCGERQGPVEPDARGYQCEACGDLAVYGAAELAIAGRVR